MGVNHLGVHAQQAGYGCFVAVDGKGDGMRTCYRIEAEGVGDRLFPTTF